MANFIIIKQYVRLFGASDIEKQYLIIRPEHNKHSKVEWTAKGFHIEREEAQRIIKEQGFTIALKNKHGVVWDTPDQDFLNTYKGNILIPDNLGV